MTVMGGPLAWWILGALVVGGGAAVVYVVTRDGTKKDIRQVCLKDLPEPKFSQVKKAMDDKDVNALNAFALQAHKEGWTCAANELATAAQRIESAKVKIHAPTPTPGELTLDPAIMDPKLPDPVTPASPVGSVVDPALATCADTFGYLNGEEQEAIVAAINKYRSTGDATILNGIALSFQSTGSKEFADCLRAQGTKVATSMSEPLLPVTVADMELPASWA